MFRPGYRFVCSYRLYRLVKVLPVVGSPLGSFLWCRSCIKYSCEIAQDACVGAGLYVPHPYGIVIGKCTIEEGVEILQNVTIGKLKSGEKSEPLICENARIGAGAVILGSVRVGKNAIVGANAVVLSNVPDNCVAVGNPARVLATD